ncbi:CLUMA_CG018397, isoform A [Clunio marinus]|uniref:CLUMA_CG018397, isoform A n=1 Tax=Clunio marinus TaxID=568069 RepID=A0A1J1IYL7_9DIPT|nr:CLUMA_CG018397, isoform A [Clunio marinus]
MRTQENYNVGKIDVELHVEPVGNLKLEAILLNVPWKKIIRSIKIISEEKHSKHEKEIVGQMLDFLLALLDSFNNGSTTW